MHYLAIDQQRLTGKSYPQSYTSVYAASQNAALREAVHREHISNSMARAG